MYPFASAGANLKSKSECVSTAAPGQMYFAGQRANDANLDRNLLPLLQTCMHTMLLFRTSFSSSYSLAVLYLQRLCISKETQPITRFPPRKTRAKVDAKTAQYIPYFCLIWWVQKGHETDYSALFCAEYKTSQVVGHDTRFVAAWKIPETRFLSACFVLPGACTLLNHSQWSGAMQAKSIVVEKGGGGW